MENPNYYAIIPSEIRYDKELTANSKLLYGEITALCNEKGICWASNKYFADLYGTTKETISRWISQLAKKEYIFIKMFYKKDSKEIDRRIISINKFKDEKPIDENDNTYIQKNQYNDVPSKITIPYIQKYGEGIGKNVKENITSINNKEKEEGLSKIIDFYQNNITLIVDHVAEEMESFLDDGLEPELIIAAMEEAVDRNKRNWKYIKTILNDCINNKVSTAKQFKIKQEEFKSNKKQPEKKDVTKEKVEYAEIEMTEEEYRKKLFEKGNEDV